MMTAPDNPDNYFIGKQYTEKYFPKLAPTHLNTILMHNGYKKLDLNRAFTYFELGCGNGLTTNLLASAYPQATFYGNDFMPEHIGNARELAAQAERDNITFYTDSFEQLLDRDDIPPLDYICAHGILSWISEDSRESIYQFIRKHLKPGGVVYLSYNCLAGCSYFVPLRKLMYEYFVTLDGTLDERVAAALKFTHNSLDLQGNMYSRNLPYAKARLGRFADQTKDYIAHELLCENWHAFDTHELPDIMGDDQVQYIGDASIRENNLDLCVHPKTLKAVSSVGCQRTRERLIEMLEMRQFRADIYQHSPTKLTKDESDLQLLSQEVTVLKPESKWKLSHDMPGGKLNLSKDYYTPLLDALYRKRLKISDAMHLSAQTTQDEYIHNVKILLAFGYLEIIRPELDQTPELVSSVRAMNMALLHKNTQGHKNSYIVTSLGGGGYKLGSIYCIVMNSIIHGDDTVENVHNHLLQNDLHISRGDDRITEPKAIREAINGYVAEFKNHISENLEVLGLHQ